MKNATEILYVFTRSKEKRAMRQKVAWKLVLAGAFMLLGAYLCLEGPLLIGMTVLVLAGFSAGLGVSRLSQAASIDDVFRG